MTEGQKVGVAMAVAVAVAWLYASSLPSTDPSVRIGAICEDGTWTSATSGGACSSHGGVAEWRYEEAESPDIDNWQPYP